MWILYLLAAGTVAYVYRLRAQGTRALLALLLTSSPALLTGAVERTRLRRAQYQRARFRMGIRNKCVNV